MKSINELREELLAAKQNEEIYEKLFEIGKELIQHYRFYTPEGVFIPLWVEAYYKNNNIFVDEATDGHKDQKNREWKFYIGQDKFGNYRRIDIVLSNSNDYYLSYLLKMGVFIDKNGFKTVINQSMVYEALKNVDQCKVKKTKFGNDNYETVECKKRIGITKGDHKEANLAVAGSVNNKKRVYSYAYYLKNRNTKNKEIGKKIPLSDFWNSLPN